ncbi:MAG: hypothetical protein ACT4QB_05330 [Gammaproteobacteria bacterium]
MKPQTLVIWLQRSAGLVAWFWLASVAEALPTFTPISIDHPTPRASAKFGSAAAGIGDVNGDGVPDLLGGAPLQRVGGIEDTAFDLNADPIPGATGQGRLLIGAPATGSLSVDPDTLPPGTGTLTDTLRIDNRAMSSSPFTLVGQTPIAGASDAIPNGNLVYVCGSSGISVFDVSNVAAPQFLRTVGTPANACQIRGDELVALRGGNTLVVVVYSLTDPLIPQRLGSTPEIPYNFAGDLAITDTHAFVTTLAFIFFLANGDIFAHIGDVLSFDISVPSAPRLDDVLFNTHGTNNDGVGSVSGVDRSGGDFNVFSLTQADAQTLLAISTTVTGGDTQSGTGVVRAVDITNPANLTALATVPLPGTVHLIGLAIQGNRALVTASSGGWQDFFNNQNAGLSGNIVLATLDVSDPRNPQIIATQTLSRASRGVNLPVSLGNNEYAFSSLGAFNDTPQLFLIDAGDPANLIVRQMQVPSEITRMRAAGNLLYTASPSGLLIYAVSADPPPFEAEPASTQVGCDSSRCRVPVTCNLAPAVGTPCTNRIEMRVRVPRRLAQDTAVKGQRQGQRRLRVFARSSATSVPPGQTANVRLRLTPLGRSIVMTSNANSLRGVIEIRNTPGTVIDTTRVRIRLRRR